MNFQKYILVALMVIVAAFGAVRGQAVVTQATGAVGGIVGGVAGKLAPSTTPAGK